MELIMEPIEAAFSIGGDDEGWFFRVIWKCPICGRRSRVLKTGTGKLEFPVIVNCKLKHATLVKPYRT